MKNLARHIIILLLLLSSGLFANAQVRRQLIMQRRQQAVRERPPIKEIKKTYISRRLSLTPEQNARFSSVYDQYQSENDGLLNARRANNTTADPGPDQFERDLGYQQKITALQKHYYDEFSKIMSPEKASQVFRSEKQFTIELVRRLKEGGAAANFQPAQQQP